jgi:uncharacterized protein with von Willebrand factor type A (vWA) domain
MSGARLDSAKSAAKNISEIMKPNDRMSIVTFDSQAFFKLKPRPVEQIRRQNELPEILDKIFAQGSTALYDACCLILDQRRDITRKTIVILVTDGEDNSSKHSYEETLNLIKSSPNLVVCMVNISNLSPSNEKYKALCVNGLYLDSTDGRVLEDLIEIFTTMYNATTI